MWNVIYNCKWLKYITYPWTSAIMIFGIVLVKGDCVSIRRNKLNYKLIKSKQYFDFLILFLILKLLFSYIPLILLFFSYHIFMISEILARFIYSHLFNCSQPLEFETSLEKEATENMYDDTYLYNRKPFQFLKYFK